MKVLLVNDFTAPVGGAEKNLKNTLLTLSETSVIPNVFSSDETGIQFIQPFVSWKWYGLLKDFLTGNQVDIIHNFGIKHIMAPSLFLAEKRYSNAKIVYHIQDFYMFCPKFGITREYGICPDMGQWFSLHSQCRTNNWIYGTTAFNLLKAMRLFIHRRIVLDSVDMFLAPSQIMVRWLQTYFGVPAGKIVYFPSYADIHGDSLPEAGNTDGRRFLIIGRLSMEKGFDVAVNALHQLRTRYHHPDAILDIVGDGPAGSYLRRLVRRLGLTDAVRFRGVVPNDHVEDYYRRSLAVLIPSVWLENNPLVALEAMKYGKPILGSRVGGIPDLICHDRTGWLFPVGQAGDLAAYMDKLYGNIPLSRTMGRNGFLYARRNFSQRIYRQRLLDVYSRLLKGVK